MDAVCLLVAGFVRASMPSPDFTLAWQHSVEKTRWEERYRVDGAELVLTEVRIEGNGAGMEPPPSAVLRDGTWTWRPLTRIPELRLTRSTYARDYTVCSRAGCRVLGDLTGAAGNGDVIIVRPCRPGDRSAKP